MNPQMSPMPGAEPPLSPDLDQPVAYDQYGRPLYARPQPTRQIVQVTRPIDPIEPEISQDVMARYEESRRKYPDLNISPGEYVISAVKRHPIGLVQIWAISFLMIVACMALLANFFVGPAAQDAATLAGSSQSLKAFGMIAIVVVLGLSVLGGLVATYVYTNNRFYLTNESVIQHIQSSLFAKREQTVSLSNIEDASYEQHTLIQNLFNYGAIRLSTEGDETTYRFTFVANPKTEIATLNNAVEAFKMGRPVHGGHPIPHPDQPS